MINGLVAIRAIAPVDSNWFFDWGSVQGRKLLLRYLWIVILWHDLGAALAEIVLGLFYLYPTFRIHFEETPPSLLLLRLLGLSNLVIGHRFQLNWLTRNDFFVIGIQLNVAK
jgi:hypothetical protein